MTRIKRIKSSVCIQYREINRQTLDISKNSIKPTLYETFGPLRKLLLYIIQRKLMLFGPAINPSARRHTTYKSKFLAGISILLYPLYCARYCSVRCIQYISSLYSEQSKSLQYRDGILKVKTKFGTIFIDKPFWCTIPCRKNYFKITSRKIICLANYH